MNITQTTVTIEDLARNYNDDGEGGVYALNNTLVCRPKYQREFCYSEDKRNAVMDSVMHKLPLGVFYWSICKDGQHTYEVLDGQQRIISICQYIAGEYSIDHRFYFNLTPEEQEKIDKYQIIVFICDGTEAERLAWFQRINVAGMVLTNQELLNAAYTGPWLSDAKTYFSKRSCVAYQMANGYIKGNPIRQELLEKALFWAADRDKLAKGQDYMAAHQHDTDANDLWLYFQEVINWAQRLFPVTRKGITDKQDWGLLYNRYQGKSYNSNALEKEMQKLIKDKDVTNKSGIIPYLLIWYNIYCK